MKTRLGLKPLKVMQPELFQTASPISVTILRWVDVLTVRYNCSKKEAKKLLAAALALPRDLQPGTSPVETAVQTEILIATDLIVRGESLRPVPLN